MNLSNLFLNRHDDDLVSNAKIGLEIETVFAPRTDQARDLNLYFKSKYGFKCKEYHEFRDKLIEILPTEFKKARINEFVEFKPEGENKNDQGIELLTDVLNLYKHQERHEQYQKGLDILKRFYCTDKLGEDGIHLTIDHILFGPTLEWQASTVDNIIWFLYYNVDFVIQLSKRLYYFSSQIDMLFWLGDFLKQKTDRTRLRSLKENRQIIMDCLKGSERVLIFNTNINKIEGVATEFKWFGSSLDAKHMITMIEFMVFLAGYAQIAKSSRSMKLSPFCKVLLQYTDVFPFLFEEMRLNEFSRKYCKF